MPVRLDMARPDFAERFADLLGTKREISEDVDTAVRDIIASVVARGDAALCEYSQRFDRVDLTEDRDCCHARGDRRALKPNAMTRSWPPSISRMHASVCFTRSSGRRDERFTDELGVELGWRWTALESVGLYVPGGTASYPSSVLMNAVPAKVAGVERLVMVVPAPDGVIDPLVLVAAKRAGVDEIYRVGGAQAIAALAFGTQTIKPVAKIVGPGNAYVAAAKRRVFGTVGIDMIAGPSEVLVLADRTGNPAWIAADMLAQAEHDPAAQAILITDEPALADAVETEITAAIGNAAAARDRRRELARFRRVHPRAAAR